MELVQLLTLCLEFKITQDQVNDLEQGFWGWVQKYEWYVLLVASRMLSDRSIVYTTYSCRQTMSTKIINPRSIIHLTLNYPFY